MCGIAGAICFKNSLDDNTIIRATEKLAKRGPDNQGVYRDNSVFFGHRRLSIIDTSADANQPLVDQSEDYAIIFNGEIYNFKSIRSELQQKGFSFRTNSDTEVLLKAFICYGEKMVELLNGFFAFAIYDKINQHVFIARDRLGIKPLYVAQYKDSFFFASEMKAMYMFNFPKQINKTALSIYLQLNYIPAPLTIYEQIQKLFPGECLSINILSKSVTKTKYYTPEISDSSMESSYKTQQKELVTLLDDSVKKRMVSDVPLGAFLSGGIDSSVICSLASKYTSKLNTFSIGFKDNAYFDETEYAELVAKKLKTNHTVFKLSNDDLLQSLDSLLNYIDEPFADSSALLVNILSRETRKHVTVALSGDGGDELFAGYNKHYGELRIRQKGFLAQAVTSLHFVWKLLPKSRNGTIGNKIRQFERFAISGKLTSKERYWRLCAYQNLHEAQKFLKPKYQLGENQIDYSEIKNYYTSHITGDPNNLNDFLLSDILLVLPNDMLTKVDLMSMANSLEVRVPFLDHRMVDFALSIPTTSKIDRKIKKKIVQDAFQSILPKELYNRPKKGFEVPLVPWFKNELSDLIFNNLLEQEFIQEQGIFDHNIVKYLQQKLHSNNPGDVHAHIWALIVFQSWYKNYHLKYA